MLDIAENFPEDLQVAANVLYSYAGNIEIKVKLAEKEEVVKEDIFWVIKCNNEDALIKAFKIIHRKKFGSIKWWRVRMENYTRDKTSLRILTMPF